jgi:hypothetical protein
VLGRVASSVDAGTAESKSCFSGRKVGDGMDSGDLDLSSVACSCRMWVQRDLVRRCRFAGGFPNG